MAINEDVVRRFVQTTMQAYLGAERDMVAELPAIDAVETALAIRSVSGILWGRIAKLIIDRVGEEVARPIIEAAQRLADEAELRTRPSVQA